MKFRQLAKEQACLEVINEIANLHAEGSLLVLLSGGSNAELGAKINAELSTNVVNKLTFALIDERYGEVGHPNSNWTKLIQSGFNENKFPTINVLDGSDINTATISYQSRLAAAMNDHKYVVGIFGLGSDGHTAGILPYSSVLTSPSIIDCYAADDFQRITITPASIKNFTHGYCLAYGGQKQQQIIRLTTEVDPSEQPAQLLKKIPEITIFSDFDVQTQDFQANANEENI